VTRGLFFFAFSAYGAGNSIPPGFLNRPWPLNRIAGKPRRRFDLWRAGTPALAGPADDHEFSGSIIWLGKVYGLRIFPI
jgi:hypothetical protein